MRSTSSISGTDSREDPMKAHLAILTALLVFLVSIAVCPGAAQAGAPGIPSVAIQWVVGDALGPAARDWKLGMGFNVYGSLPVSSRFDVRGDCGLRWLEGEDRLVTNPDRAPRWGGLPGETTQDLRVMPFTLDLVHRFEGLSHGQFWVPYLAAGPGFYDMRATFADADGVERDHTLFDFGWNARGGVRFYRTSGLHISLEAATHLVNTPGEWSPFWEVALGLGAIVPGPSH
jgi:hypothetical protein